MSKRPFRIYDSKTKKNLPYRNYVYLHNAHVGALIQVRWAKVGTVLEVVNAATGDLTGQYKRGVTGITFTKLKEE